jgi:hypothetical protein
MQVSELSKKLEEDAANAVPVWGAESIALVRQLGAAATPALLEHIKPGGATALLALEGLRVADPKAYAKLPARERAEIYGHSLQDDLFYNNWGLPGFRLTETSQALTALGEEAIPVLLPLLSERKAAPLSGSQDATTSTAYGNRVRDYAWVFILEIKNRPYTYQRNPDERDKEIIALQNELQNEEK